LPDTTMTRQVEATHPEEIRLGCITPTYIIGQRHDKVKNSGWEVLAGEEIDRLGGV
jgi:hypothetical protein